MTRFVKEVSVGAFLVDKHDQLFVINEMLNIEKLCGFERFSEHKNVALLLREAHRFAKNVFYPTLVDGDRQGCVYDSQYHSVQFPESYKKPYEKFRDGGWLTMCDDPEVGGEGYPLTVGAAVSEIFYASGFYIYGAAELSHAGAKAIEKFGSDAQKELYMKRLFSGEWMGTMCLTEPQAGSDVGNVETRASRNPDGTYGISGVKIFITAGEQNLTENIVHMVLARVDGAPPGVKGLSLFIVPKYLSDEKGNLRHRNDVHCMGIEHKMGLNGLATCTMAFGDNDDCIAYLIGKQGDGILEMFNMMNEQRLLVGLQGLSYSSAAFLHALEYASNRKQGRSAELHQRGSVPIINHPDIKRMLLTMKAHVDGGRALAYFTSMCIDYAGVTEDGSRSSWHGLVELLTPLVKAYLTDNAWKDTGMAIQCVGGYGYCTDYPFERLARDCKVASIYEGTNGIQAIDLLIRKILFNRCVNFNHLMEIINQTIRQVETDEDLCVYAAKVKTVRQDLEDVVRHFAELSDMGKTGDVYAKASLFLEAMGDVIIGWLHLWQLDISHLALKKAVESKPQHEAADLIKRKKNLSFYYGKKTCAQFYIGTLLEITKGKLKALKSSSDPVADIFENAFSG